MDEQAMNTLVAQILDLLKTSGCTFGEFQSLLLKLQAAVQTSVGGKAL